MIGKLKTWAKQIKANLSALYYAQQHPQLPWYCRAFIWLTLLYALSPIDLIPDFIPILGLLDDLLLLPLGIWVCIKLIPNPIWQQSVEKAVTHPLKLPKQKKGLMLMLFIWLALLLLFWRYWRA